MYTITIMKKILITSFLTLLFIFGANAGTDGVNELSKNKPKQVKDCFERLNRGTFALNQGLDKVIFKPVAKAYRSLPSPIRSGTNNALVNLSSLVTIPNNVLQGDLKIAFTHLREDLGPHLLKEGRILFPLIKKFGVI